MGDYTPDTEYVRAQYARMENYDPYYEGDLYLTPDGQLSSQEFDRWLAEHDHEVAKAERERIIALLEDFQTQFGKGWGTVYSEGFASGIAECLALIKGEKNV